MTDQKFYLTFGVQYPSTPHPRWAGAHKDGWVTIMARDYDQAMELANAHFGKDYSQIIPGNHFPEEFNKRKYYPKGQLALLTTDSIGRSTLTET